MSYAYSEDESCDSHMVTSNRWQLQQDLVNVGFSCYISSSYIVIAAHPI
jgi:hypothetical protein